MCSQISSRSPSLANEIDHLKFLPLVILIPIIIGKVARFIPLALFIPTLIGLITAGFTAVEIGTKLHELHKKHQKSQEDKDKDGEQSPKITLDDMIAIVKLLNGKDLTSWLKK